MPQQKLTIVPVTLHTEKENTSATNPAMPTTNRNRLITWWIEKEQNLK